MKRTRRLSPLGFMFCATLAWTGLGAAQESVSLPPGVTPPQPTVPEIFTLKGEFVRIA